MTSKWRTILRKSSERYYDTTIHSEGNEEAKYRKAPGKIEEGDTKTQLKRQVKCECNDIPARSCLYDEQNKEFCNTEKRTLVPSMLNSYYRISF
jgi:hypothetical protein